MVSSGCESVKLSNDLGRPVLPQWCTVWKSGLRMTEIYIRTCFNSAYWILEDVVCALMCPVL